MRVAGSPPLRGPRLRQRWPASASSRAGTTLSGCIRHWVIGNPWPFSKPPRSSSPRNRNHPSPPTLHEGGSLQAEAQDQTVQGLVTANPTTLQTALIRPGCNDPPNEAQRCLMRNLQPPTWRPQTRADYDRPPAALADVRAFGASARSRAARMESAASTMQPCASVGASLRNRTLFALLERHTRRGRCEFANLYAPTSHRPPQPHGAAACASSAAARSANAMPDTGLRSNAVLPVSASSTARRTLASA